MRFKFQRFWGLFFLALLCACLLMLCWHKAESRRADQLYQEAAQLVSLPSSTHNAVEATPVRTGLDLSKLRQDNADERLVEIGTRIGLNPPERLEKTRQKYETVRAEIERTEHTGIAPTPVLQSYLEACHSAPLKNGVRLSDLIRRPELSYDGLAPFDPDRPALPPLVREQVEIRIKYDGYIRRQLDDVEQFRKLEGKLLPEGIDYQSIPSLRLEALQKLDRIRPRSFGQASLISGVSPADITALMIYVAGREGEQ